MRLLWLTLAFVLMIYLLLLLARLVIDWTRNFARSWWPSGAAAVGVEVVYSATDPPLKLLKRLIPPLRIGQVNLDLSLFILLLIVFILRGVILGFV